MSQPDHLDLTRYRGHLTLPEVGLDGQRKLAKASVLCIGTGGLGSPAALYLTAAGVGRVGLLDSDEVDTSNLHRQVLFRTEDVGARKVEAARRTLSALNPDVALVTHDVRLTPENAADLLRGYDVIIDGTDNFRTRYLVNDTCVRLGKPDVWASIHRFEGQVSVFDASRGPCYRCLFPVEPPPDQIPSCAEAGVLGVLPGILGTMQATEAIKLILGVGHSLVGRLLVFDALAMTWNELALPKDPSCPACGRAATAPSLPLPLAAPAAEASPPVPSIGPQELKRRLEAGEDLTVLDCRDPHEWEICRLPGSLLIPLKELSSRLGEVDRDRPVVVHCYRGPRSIKAAAMLTQAGFQSVQYLEGGLHGWAQHIDPTMPLY